MHQKYISCCCHLRRYNIRSGKVSCREGGGIVQEGFGGNWLQRQSHNPITFCNNSFALTVVPPLSPLHFYEQTIPNPYFKRANPFSEFPNVVILYPMEFAPFSSSWNENILSHILFSSHILFRLDTAETEVRGISRDKEHLVAEYEVWIRLKMQNYNNSLRSFEPRGWIQIHLHIHCWSPGQSCISST